MMTNLVGEAMRRMIAWRRGDGAAANDILPRDAIKIAWVLGTMGSDNGDVGDALVHLIDAIRGHWIDGRESRRPLAGWTCADLVATGDRRRATKSTMMATARWAMKKTTVATARRATARHDTTTTTMTTGDDNDNDDDDDDDDGDCAMGSGATGYDDDDDGDGRRRRRQRRPTTDDGDGATGDGIRRQWRQRWRQTTTTTRSMVTARWVTTSMTTMMPTMMTMATARRKGDDPMEGGRGVAPQPNCGGIY
jgi:hypothetical protein